MLPVSPVSVILSGASRGLFGRSAVEGSAAGIPDEADKPQILRLRAGRSAQDDTFVSNEIPLSRNCHFFRKRPAVSVGRLRLRHLPPTILAGRAAHLAFERRAEGALRLIPQRQRNRRHRVA